MRYEFTNNLTTEASQEALWHAWTDVDSWPDWDSHIQSAHLDGTFEAGATGTVKPKGAPGGPVTFTEVVPPLRWVSVSSTPIGNLTFTHSIVDNGATRTLTEHMRAEGLIAPVFRLIWARNRRAAGKQTLAALAARASAAD
jgi:uncharacterized protein YndB with AHSA1/START domain